MLCWLRRDFRRDIFSLVISAAKFLPTVEISKLNVSASSVEVFRILVPIYILGIF